MTSAHTNTMPSGSVFAPTPSPPSPTGCRLQRQDRLQAAALVGEVGDPGGRPELGPDDQSAGAAKVADWEGSKGSII